MASDCQSMFFSVPWPRTSVNGPSDHLSGNGTDGTLGVKAIKEELGMVMAQDVNSAKYDGMPFQRG